MDQQIDNSLVQVRRLIDLHEFRRITGISESAVRHNPRAYAHLMVKTPQRRIAFDSVKVNLGMMKGDLTK